MTRVHKKIWRKCTECGAHATIDNNIFFCRKCGTEIKEAKRKVKNGQKYSNKDL